MHKNKQFSFLFSFFLLNQIEAIRFCWLLMKRNKLWRNESIHALIADDTNNAQFKQSLNGKNTIISTKQYECRGTNCTFYVHRASFGVHRHIIFVSPQIRCNISNHVFFCWDYIFLRIVLNRRQTRTHFWMRKRLLAIIWIQFHSLISISDSS